MGGRKVEDRGGRDDYFMVEIGEKRMGKKVNSSKRLRLHMDEWIGYHVLISAFAVPFFIGIVETESFP